MAGKAIRSEAALPSSRYSPQMDASTKEPCVPGLYPEGCTPERFPQYSPYKARGASLKPLTERKQGTATLIPSLGIQPTSSTCIAYRPLRNTQSFPPLFSCWETLMLHYYHHHYYDNTATITFSSYCCSIIWFLSINH